MENQPIVSLREDFYYSNAVYNGIIIDLFSLWIAFI
jgi:hypothetical protein